MKKKPTWVLLAVLAASVIALVGYMAADAAMTDSQPPRITMDEAELTLSVKDPESAVLQGVTAMDDRDGDVTASILVESIYGISDDQYVTVTYAAADSSGNVAKAQRKIRYADYESPRFTLKAPLVFEAGSGFDVMSLVGARDVLDGDIQWRVKATLLSEVASIAQEGTHQVQFRVTNSLGDTARVELPVEVYPANRYNARVQLSEYLIYLPLGAEFDALKYPVYLHSYDEKYSLVGQLADGLKLQVSGVVDTDTPGIYPISYTASYVEEADTYVGYTRLLVIVEEEAA